MPKPALFDLRPAARNAPQSGIVEIFDYGRDKPGLLPLWVGEGDMPTPQFIRDAAIRSLGDGETFYTHQAGIPALRAAISSYLGALYGREVSPERLYVTSGGMHALQIAITMIAGPGDEVLIPTPAWPNFRGALTISGADAVDVPMHFGSDGWQLDLADLERAITPRTRAIVINSPANPTGWTAKAAEISAILSMARRHGLWILADEIYARFVYAGERSPSFRDVTDDDDKIIFIQTFSKNWAMTGWRIGWLEVPPALGATAVNLIQYSSSGTPVFIQRAALAALEGGGEIIREQVARAQTNRDILIEAFSHSNRLRAKAPDGAFYLFFGIEGLADPRNAAFALVDRANVGLAPGEAFGKGGEGFLRLCYLRKSADIEEAARRILDALPD